MARRRIAGCQRHGYTSCDSDSEYDCPSDSSSVTVRVKSFKLNAHGRKSPRCFAVYASSDDLVAAMDAEHEENNGYRFEPNSSESRHVQTSCLSNNQQRNTAINSFPNSGQRDVNKLNYDAFLHRDSKYNKTGTEFNTQSKPLPLINYQNQNGSIDYLKNRNSLQNGNLETVQGRRTDITSQGDAHDQKPLQPHGVVFEDHRKGLTSDVSPLYNSATQNSSEFELDNCGDDTLCDPNEKENRQSLFSRNHLEYDGGISSPRNSNHNRSDRHNVLVHRGFKAEVVQCIKSTEQKLINNNHESKEYSNKMIENFHTSEKQNVSPTVWNGDCELRSCTSPQNSDYSDSHCNGFDSPDSSSSVIFVGSRKEESNNTTLKNENDGIYVRGIPTTGPPINGYEKLTSQCEISINQTSPESTYSTSVNETSVFFSDDSVMQNGDDCVLQTSTPRSDAKTCSMLQDNCHGHKHSNGFQSPLLSPIESHAPPWLAVFQRAYEHKFHPCNDFSEMDLDTLQAFNHQLQVYLATVRNKF